MTHLFIVVRKLDFYKLRDEYNFPEITVLNFLSAAGSIATASTRLSRKSVWASAACVFGMTLSSRMTPRKTYGHDSDASLVFGMTSAQTSIRL